MTAAPIQRYSDPRLYGKALTLPFEGSYHWIRTTTNPMSEKVLIRKNQWNDLEQSFQVFLEERNQQE